MKVLLLTGSHPRHLYLVNQLMELGLVAAHVMELRESFVPQPPENLEKLDRDHFVRHFKDRDEAENRHFAGHTSVIGNVPTLEVSLQGLNSSETIDWVKSQTFDVAISYGVHKLDNELLDALGENAWNIHGGLSPWYKGNTTLFWPFFMLRPNWAGMTVHRLSARLDAGDIVHQSVPLLEYGDGLHDVACKAVKQVAKDLGEILAQIPLEDINYTPQRGNGKLWIGTDWIPQHLRFVYDTYNNDIVDHFLDAKLPKIDPPIISALTKGDK
ncbi:methionyl-tRNA formyltransferase [Ureibacillus chungkukjangi]|uniref:formyltransferase family protein n=1 Tax=Ureibacillus chungkukjangi TaxID=1202712 RepID=UPI00203BA8F8|nr:formyltransferase family protein [Ureibacillus chungkukjangi]MCM3389785.1 methionyl-tRNA formyltransferase [Ureibacillus chungkukjangi]